MKKFFVIATLLLASVFAVAQPQLIPYTAPDNSFSISLPRTPEVTTDKGTTKSGVTYTSIDLDATLPDLAVLFSQTTYAKALEAGAIDNAGNALAETVKGTIIKTFDYPISGYYAKVFFVQTPESRVIFLIAVKGNQAYFLAFAVSPENATEQSDLVTSIIQSFVIN